MTKKDKTTKNFALRLDPETMEAIEKWESIQEKYGDGTRWRKYNDYKNTDAIIK